jgi:hypothetical protein
LVVWLRGFAPGLGICGVDAVTLTQLCQYSFDGPGCDARNEISGEYAIGGGRMKGLQGNADTSRACLESMRICSRNQLHDYLDRTVRIMHSIVLL